MMKRATTTMASTFSPKPSRCSGIRSISLPTRSHPTTLRIEEELNKLKSFWDTPSSSSSKEVETICSALLGLVELYKCVEDLLKLPLTQQALSHHHNEIWVDELLDCPLRFLDILVETRDSIMAMKGNVRELQSAFRRRRKVIGELSMESHVISSYWSLRRKMRKECTKSLLSLKQIDHSFGASTPLDLNNHLSAIVRVLREASLITSSVFQSMLAFLSSPIFFKSKMNNKWAFVSRLMQKGVLVVSNNQQQQNINELEKVDMALCRVVMDSNQNYKDFETHEKIQSTQRELEAVVVVIERIENGLDCFFKHLVNTRVSFLNILSP